MVRARTPTKLIRKRGAIFVQDKKDDGKFTGDRLACNDVSNKNDKKPLGGVRVSLVKPQQKTTKGKNGDIKCLPKVSKKSRKKKKNEEDDEMIATSSDPSCSGASSGLDCLCDAVELELSGRTGDHKENTDMTHHDDATTPRKDIITDKNDNEKENNNEFLVQNTKTHPDSNDINRTQLLSTENKREREQQRPFKFEPTKPSAFQAITIKEEKKPKQARNAKNQRLEITAQQREDILSQIRLIQHNIWIWEQKFGRSHPEIGRMYLNLARLYSTIDLLQQATFCLTRSWETFRANLNASHSPLSCINAYRAIFKNIKGYVSGEIEKQMEEMEEMVVAVLKAASTNTDIRSSPPIASTLCTPTTKDMKPNNRHFPTTVVPNRTPPVPVSQPVF